MTTQITAYAMAKTLHKEQNIRGNSLIFQNTQLPNAPTSSTTRPALSVRGVVACLCKFVVALFSGWFAYNTDTNFNNVHVMENMQPVLSLLLFLLSSFLVFFCFCDCDCWVAGQLCAFSAGIPKSACAQGRLFEMGKSLRSSVCSEECVWSA